MHLYIDAFFGPRRKEGLGADPEKISLLDSLREFLNSQL